MNQLMFTVENESEQDIDEVDIVGDENKRPSGIKINYSFPKEIIKGTLMVGSIFTRVIKGNKSQCEVEYFVKGVNDLKEINPKINQGQYQLDMTYVLSSFDLCKGLKLKKLFANTSVDVILFPIDTKGTFKLNY